MRVLHLAREPADERTGVFTSGVVSTAEGRRIALFFTGRQHAGENLAEVLKRRAPGLRTPIQMCDAVAQHAPLVGGLRTAAGQLPGARKAAVRGDHGELP
jgi:hypothetical protein